MLFVIVVFVKLELILNFLVVGKDIIFLVKLVFSLLNIGEFKFFGIFWIIYFIIFFIEFFKFCIFLINLIIFFVYLLFG